MTLVRDPPPPNHHHHQKSAILIITGIFLMICLIILETGPVKKIKLNSNKYKNLSGIGREHLELERSFWGQGNGRDIEAGEQPQGRQDQTGSNPLATPASL